jgi:hypothetical protein
VRRISERHNPPPQQRPSAAGYSVSRRRGLPDRPGPPGRDQHRDDAPHRARPRPGGFPAGDLGPTCWPAPGCCSIWTTGGWTVAIADSGHPQPRGNLKRGWLTARARGSLTCCAPPGSLVRVAAAGGRLGDPRVRVVAAHRPHLLAIWGRHRSEFPGLRGRLYRLAVIGSGGHVAAVRRMVLRIKRAAERRGGVVTPQPVEALLARGHPGFHDRSAAGGCSFSRMPSTTGRPGPTRPASVLVCS